MKILHVITSMLSGGAEKLVSQLAPMMRDAGHQCDVALFNGESTQFRHNLVSEGIKVIDFSVGGSVYNPLYIVKLIGLMKGYDIVHTHNMSPQLFAAIGSVLCSVVLVTTEHTTSNRRRDWRWYAPVERWMYGRYKAVIGISPAATENLLCHTKISCPVYTIANGINVRQYADSVALSREEIGVGETSVVIAMVAGFRRQKDQMTVIRAISLLPSKYELVLVGGGEKFQECKECASFLGVGDRVHFLGVRSDVANILKTVNIVVMSSHYEGFGLAAVEGMAAGKPVIASNVSGLADVVRGAGLLFEHEDVEGLVKHIESLDTDTNYYNEVSARCKARAKDYDIKKMADNYLEVYEKLI